MQAVVAGGKLRALAVTSRKRVPAMQHVPTVEEQGFPEFALAGEDWMGFAVKRGTPDGIVKRLNQAVNTAAAGELPTGVIE